MFRAFKPRILGCKYDSQKNVKILLIKPGGTAYLGIKDFLDESDVEKGEKVKIDFFMRHVSTYLGDEYGSFGGIDMTLLHLKTPAKPNYPPACLPTIAFPDSDRAANIAGYGQYKRESCQTDEYGPSKYHYCNSTCETKENPPREALCKKFFKSPVSKDLGNFQDIVLDSDSELTYCYNNKSPNSDSVGWCHVSVDASNLNGLKKTMSWGFCGRDCNEVEEPEGMVLRKVEDIDILSEQLCDTFLNKSLPEDGVKVRPQILCIGKIDHIDVKAFKVAKNDFKPGNSSQIHHKSELYPGKHFTYKYRFDF